MLKGFQINWTTREVSFRIPRSFGTGDLFLNAYTQRFRPIDAAQHFSPYSMPPGPPLK